MPSIFRGMVFAMIGTFGSDRTQQDYRRWIEHAGGEYKSTYSRKVTHLVVSEGAWDIENPIIKEAIEREEVAIVKQPFIDEAITSQKKPAKKRIPPAVNWRKVLKANIKTSSPGKSKSKADDSSSKKVSRSKLVNEFAEESAEYAPRPAKRARKSKSRLMRSSSTDSFAESAKVAKQVLKSGDYHFYVDETSFTYDLMLVKVLKSLNQNQQLHLRIFESNNDPQTYAVVRSTQELKNGKDVNKAVCPTGAPFATALHSFKEEFKRLTGIKWDERFSKIKCSEPKKVDASAHFITQGDLLKVGGYRYTTGAKQLTEQEWEAFDKQLWMWRRPAEGEPQGVDTPSLVKAPSSSFEDAQQGAAPDSKDPESNKDDTMDWDPFTFDDTPAPSPKSDTVEGLPTRQPDINAAEGNNFLVGIEDAAHSGSGSNRTQTPSVSDNAHSTLEEIEREGNGLLTDFLEPELESSDAPASVGSHEPQSALDTAMDEEKPAGVLASTNTNVEAQVQYHESSKEERGMADEDMQAKVDTPPETDAEAPSQREPSKDDHSMGEENMQDDVSTEPVANAERLEEPMKEANGAADEPAGKPEGFLEPVVAAEPSKVAHEKTKPVTELTDLAGANNGKEEEDQAEDE